ncbi:MAG TPA: RNA polymerase sigma factor [Longimicrobium sp.]|nr:RNA polymerase sigma factor [Longimicrobium sp.]
MTAPPTQRTLLERTSAGDADALAELYRAHGAAVHAVAYRLTASAADADDVLQDVFVGLPEALRLYDGRGSLEGWLRRVAARTALMRMRRSTRRGEVALDDHPTPAAPPADAAARVDIERALAALAPGLRAVFVLREVEGYSHAEIGELMGLRAGTSQVRLHRARQRLREILKER